jgi:TolB-like protein
VLLLHLALVAFVASSGCGSAPPTPAWTHPRADLQQIKRVAVLPFESLTGEKEAGRKVQDLFTVELLGLDVFEVAEPGEVLRASATASINLSDPLGPDELKKLGAALKVQGFFMGSVMEYRERQVGSLTSPEVSIALRLVEVESGQIVWTAATGRSGLSWSTRLFGVKESSLQEVSLDVVREALSTLVGGHT